MRRQLEGCVIRQDRKQFTKFCAHLLPKVRATRQRSPWARQSAPRGPQGLPGRRWTRAERGSPWRGGAGDPEDRSVSQQLGVSLGFSLVTHAFTHSPTHSLARSFWHQVSAHDHLGPHTMAEGGVGAWWGAGAVGHPSWGARQAQAPEP